MQPRALLTALASLSLLPLVSAHADLEASSIEDGETVTAAPDTITLTFTEGVELEFSTFKLHALDLAAAPTDTHEDADHAHAEGEDDHAETEAAGTHGDESGHAELDEAAEALVPQVIDVDDDLGQLPITVSAAPGEAAAVTLDIEGDLDPGAYVAMWRVLSADGHTIEGFLTFTYQPE